MCREKRRDLAEHAQFGSRRPSPRPNDRAELAHEQHGCRLAGVIGGLPGPDAGRVGAAEGVLHGGAQDDRIDALAAFETGKQQAGRRPR